VFRITKNIHNILQGVSHPDQRITAEEKQAIIDWITENATRYWFSEDGPLRSPEEGGADVVIVSSFRLPCATCTSPRRFLFSHRPGPPILLHACAPCWEAASSGT
jgi:hypothetical protein